MEGKDGGQGGWQNEHNQISVSSQVKQKRLETKYETKKTSMI